MMSVKSPSVAAPLAFMLAASLVCVGLMFAMNLRDKELIHCYLEADFARMTPRFVVYESELERCEKLKVNLPAAVSPDFHG